MIAAPEQKKAQQEIFFRYLFKEHNGLICLARINRATKEFYEEWFEYDFHRIAEITDWIQRWTQEQDIYIAPFFFTTRKRTKENVESCPAAWADLDDCQPEKLLVEPSILIETSTRRWQALWVFTELQDPGTAEDISRRIAYYHADEGADKSGWDLTQLLRVPYTTNFKYRKGLGYEETTVTNTAFSKITPQILQDAYPQATGYEYSDIPMPVLEEMEETDPEAIMEKHKNRLMPTAARLFAMPPEHDWSKDLWQLENVLFEGGLSREEAFVICSSAACNKYRRDNRPAMLLWKEICKCYARRESEYSLLRKPEDDRPILTDQELTDASKITTVVEEYIEWAKSIGDAAWQYHQAAAFTTLSALLAGRVRLPTSFGTLVPNLWFMILADTTLTRKTTAMDLGMDLLVEIDPDAILATDGSVEGLFSALALRPGRPSVFLRDEFSGFLDAMVKKDYMAGTAESFTKLYDGKLQKRILRKEVIEVKSPVLILFAGGIKTRVLQLLTYEHVASGFLPRFIFITAESDISRLQPLGPPTERSLGERDRIRARFATIAGHYSQSSNLVIHGKPVLSPRTWEAQLTPGAWARYNKIEADLLSLGLASSQKDLLTPTYDRLAKSGLKVATLIAAARRLDDEVIITEEDLLKAFSYVEYWRHFTNEVLADIGKTTGEHQINRVFEYVRNHPGVARGEIMQAFHLDARSTSQLFDTMEQRNLIIRQKAGRGERLWIIN